LIRFTFCPGPFRALGIPYPDTELRARTVESLAVRLKNENEALLYETLEAARKVLLASGEEEPALLFTIVPVLPPYLIPHALELALRIVAYDTRIELLATLTNRLSPASQRSILGTALDAIQAQELKAPGREH